MAEIIIKNRICDIKDCGKDALEVGGTVACNLQVIFTTDQTEGRSCKPYFSMYCLDLCPEHTENLFRGNYIHAYGAQGNNTFYFKNKA